MRAALADLFTEPVLHPLVQHSLVQHPPVQHPPATVGAELLGGGSAPWLLWMLPGALILGTTPSKEPPPLQLAGRREQRRQEWAVLLPPRLPADSKGNKAGSSVCSEAGCSGRGFSQLCLGPACSITSCAHPRADASLTVPHGERLQRSR